MTPVELFWPAMIGVVLLGVVLIFYTQLANLCERLTDWYQGREFDRRIRDSRCECSRCLTKEWENQ